MHTLEAVLPSESFVGFHVPKAKSPLLYWSRRHDKRDPLAFAYAMPMADEPAVIDSSQAPIMFNAERYGGEGLGGNGGGARCGLLGDIQVKGIGRNPLAGISTDKFHSHGGASLSECILDALWGEIASAVLPYGASRCWAIIRIAGTVPRRYSKTGESPGQARAIVLREPALRPAHFMRSIYFDAGNGQQDRLVDVRRTRQAIQYLPRALATTLGKSNSDEPECTDVDRIDALLVEWCMRCARQLAAARAKRLMHGSLTASNIGFDGRWLDFGSMSAVSDYGRLILPRGAPDFLNEEKTIYHTLHDLVFYINKYIGANNGSKALIADKYCGVLRDMLSEHEGFEFEKLTGLPLEAFEMADPVARTKLQRAIRAIRAAGNSTAFTILSDDNNYLPIMPEKMGRYKLNEILQTVGDTSTPVESHDKVKSLLPDESMRREFLSSYWSIRNDWMLSLNSQEKIAAKSFVSVNSERLNMDLRRLYRTNLYPMIERIGDSHPSVSEMIDDLVGEAKFHLSECRVGFARNPAWSIPGRVDAVDYLLSGGLNREKWEKFVSLGEQTIEKLS